MTLKYALIIGSNYFNTESELRGCINDTKMIRRFLLQNGYNKDNICVLRDDDNGTIAYMKDKIKNIRPTKENILLSLTTMIELSNKNINVELFLYYSGHGASIKDINKDEKDGKDEVIIPCDFQINGYIIDDQIRKIIGKLKQQNKLYCLMDCCHSATSLDLPFVYEYEKNKKSLILKENNSTKYPELVGKNIFVISGCRDNQTSSDLGSIYVVDSKTDNIDKNDIINVNQTGGGALTSNILKCWKTNIGDIQNVYKLLITPEFTKKFTQYPVFSSCVEIKNNKELECVIV